MSGFSKAARTGASSPEARRKAVATMKRNRALKQQGKTEVFQIADLPNTTKPAPKRAYANKKGGNPDKIQLAAAVIAIIDKILS